MLRFLRDFARLILTSTVLLVSTPASLSAQSELAVDEPLPGGAGLIVLVYALIKPAVERKCVSLVTQA